MVSWFGPRSVIVFRYILYRILASIVGVCVLFTRLKWVPIKEFENTSLVNPTVVKNYTYGTFVNTDKAETFYVLPDVVDDEIYNGSLLLVPIGRKVFYSSGRVNPAMLTRGAVGGYTFAEVSQPNNGTYRIEFTTKNTAADFQNTHTALTLVSNLYGGFTKNLNTLDIWYPFPEATENACCSKGLSL